MTDIFMKGAVLTENEAQLFSSVQGVQLLPLHFYDSFFTTLTWKKKNKKLIVYNFTDFSGSPVSEFCLKICFCA